MFAKCSASISRRRFLGLQLYRPSGKIVSEVLCKMRETIDPYQKLIMGRLHVLVEHSDEDVVKGWPGVVDHCSSPYAVRI